MEVLFNFFCHNPNRKTCHLLDPPQVLGVFREGKFCRHNDSVVRGGLLTFLLQKRGTKRRLIPLILLLLLYSPECYFTLGPPHI